jgi:hypothetical protein
MSIIKYIKKVAGIFNMLSPLIGMWTGGRVNIADAAIPMADKIQIVESAFKEIQELLDAMREAITPDADGAVRLTEDELDRIIDEADDIPAAIVKIVGR